MVMSSEACKLSEACTGCLPAISKPCTDALGWFKTLTETYTMQKEELEQHDVTLQLGRALHPGMTDPEVSLTLLQSLPHFDRGLCLASLGLESMPVYELAICSDMIRLNRAMSLATFRAEAGSWRECGLYHVLMLAARHMPDIASWVDEKHRGESSAKGLECLLRSLSPGQCKTCTEARDAVGKFVASQSMGQASALRIAAVLERLAVCMGVRCLACSSFCSICLFNVGLMWYVLAFVLLVCLMT